MCLQCKSFENTVGKGEIARNEQFLLFPVFSTCLENFLPFSSNEIVVCKIFQFGRVFNSSFGKGLIVLYMIAIFFTSLSSIPQQMQTKISQRERSALSCNSLVPTPRYRLSRRAKRSHPQI